jgi:hypothetical protein
LPGDNGLVLECKHGACAYACLEERDCQRFFRCTSTQPGTPGNCVLIGTPGQLFCDPDDADAECMCLDGTTSTQACKQDGSGLDPCSCN